MHGSIFPPNKLRNVDLGNWGALSDNITEVVQAGDFRSSETLLEQSKTPVRGELCVTSWHEVHGHLGVKTPHHTPQEIP